MDWLVLTTVSVGFLYVVPILLASSQLKGGQVLATATFYAILREQFSPLPWTAWAILRILVGLIGFALIGYFVSELNRKRRLVLEHVSQLEGEIRLRQTAEQQVRILIETSPLAILTLNQTGRVLLANRSAQELLGCPGEVIEGADVRPLLPILGRILETQQPTELRTTVECKAQRRDGEAFLAHIWLSTYITVRGPELAAVIWDASENLRDREGAGLDSMLATSRVLIGAVSHEIRNLACAAVSAYKEVLPVLASERSDEARALSTILQALVALSSSGLALSSDQPRAVTELGTVLDEARIVIEPAIREAGGRIDWKVEPGLPLVLADHHGLLQVFLNLARNSERAIRSAPVRELSMEAVAERDLVVVKFRDSGSGVPNPEVLFKPFQSTENSAGLGLYISRAILRAHGGDLKYAAQPDGSCFTVELWPAEGRLRG
jgi:PAS domain S-box-containing protein